MVETINEEFTLTGRGGFITKQVQIALQIPWRLKKKFAVYGGRNIIHMYAYI